MVHSLLMGALSENRVDDRVKAVEQAIRDSQARGLRRAWWASGVAAAAGLLGVFLLVASPASAGIGFVIEAMADVDLTYRFTMRAEVSADVGVLSETQEQAGSPADGESRQPRFGFGPGSGRGPGGGPGAGTGARRGFGPGVGGRPRAGRQRGPFAQGDRRPGARRRPSGMAAGGAGGEGELFMRGSQYVLRRRRNGMEFTQGYNGKTKWFVHPTLGRFEGRSPEVSALPQSVSELIEKGLQDVLANATTTHGLVETATVPATDGREARRKFEGRASNGSTMTIFVGAQSNLPVELVFGQLSPRSDSPLQLEVRLLLTSQENLPADWFNSAPHEQ
ncbi:MAG: hypothetical protein AAGG01_09075 [Planctomycetota bacterium]